MIGQAHNGTKVSFCFNNGVPLNTTELIVSGNNSVGGVIG